MTYLIWDSSLKGTYVKPETVIKKFDVRGDTKKPISKFKGYRKERVFSEMLNGTVWQHVSA